MSEIKKLRFAVSELEGVDGYKLATGLIVPRPIGWVGTVSAAGVRNLAPYSFFNAISGNPPMFVFSPGRGARKDTLDNVIATGEFSLNIVTAEVAEAMNFTSATVDADVDEFEHAGVTPFYGEKTAAPMVAECKANIECVVTDIVNVGDPHKGNALVIGEAVEFHIAANILDGTRVDQAKLRAIGRHVGNAYSNATDLFDLTRPP